MAATAAAAGILGRLGRSQWDKAHREIDMDVLVQVADEIDLKAAHAE